MPNLSKIRIKTSRGEFEYDLGSTTIHDFWEETTDFVIEDENGNAIVQFQGGHIKTKNFNSALVSSELSVQELEDGDFSIKDENNNMVFLCKGGNIQVKNFDSSQYTIETLFEGGDIGANGIESYSIASYNNSSRSAYFIDVKGASNISTPKAYRVYMFDENHVKLGIVYSSANEKIPIKDGTRYIRLSINTPLIDRDYITFYGGVDKPRETKKVAQRVEQGEGASSTNRSEKITFKCDDQICTTACLMLPPNYTIDGYKVPLILWDSGDGDFTSWNHEMGISYINRINGLKFCRDMGFAVLEVFAWGSDNYEKYPNNNRASMPLPTHLLTHEKGVEYVLDRYNIDPENIFHLSKSGSGKLSMYYALHKPNFNLRSIYAMGAVFDDFVFLGAGSQGYRRAMHADMRFEDVNGQLHYFLDGTPYEIGGNEQGTSWRFGSGIYKETNLPFIENVKNAHKFIIKNAHKFICMGVCWENLIGQTFEEKILYTTKSSAEWWYNITLLESKPADWDTNYNNYLIFNEEIGLWLQLDRSTAPTFEQNKYYKTNSFSPGASSFVDRVFNRNDLNIIVEGSPLTVIMAQDDEQTPYWNCLEVVNQIRNAGGSAEMITLSTGGHSAPDMGNGKNAVTNVTTLYGGTYDSVSIGWYLAVDDIIKRFIKSKSVGFPIIAISNNSVSISSKTSGATIYYTIDGSEPTENSLVYSSAIPVNDGDNYTIKAIAMKAGLWKSDMTSATVNYVV